MTRAAPHREISRRSAGPDVDRLARDREARRSGAAPAHLLDRPSVRSSDRGRRADGPARARSSRPVGLEDRPRFSRARGPSGGGLVSQPRRVSASAVSPHAAGFALRVLGCHDLSQHDEVVAVDDLVELLYPSRLSISVVFGAPDRPELCASKLTSRARIPCRRRRRRTGPPPPGVEVPSMSTTPRAGGSCPLDQRCGRRVTRAAPAAGPRTRSSACARPGDRARREVGSTAARRTRASVPGSRPLAMTSARPTPRLLRRLELRGHSAHATRSASDQTSRSISGVRLHRVELARCGSRLGSLVYSPSTSSGEQEVCVDQLRDSALRFRCRELDLSTRRCRSR